MSLTQILSEKLLFAPSRIYACHVLGDKPADAIIQFVNKIDFWVVHKYWPNFRNPRSFSEKVISRMLFDRNPLFTMISDKLRVRDYVSQELGSKYLIPLLWHGDNPEEIPFHALPSTFVIKANHGCGYNIIVKDKKTVNQPEIVLKLKKWLNENFCTDKWLGTEWAYKNIKRQILVESYIGDNGTVPVDYKFFCYSGRAEFIQLSFDRFGKQSERMLDIDFNTLDFYNGVNIYKGKVVKPDNYETMVKVAESLASNFDFIRVDLYDVAGKIYFGEMTCYPAGGRARFVPIKYDFVYGEKWTPLLFENGQTKVESAYNKT